MTKKNNVKTLIATDVYCGLWNGYLASKKGMPPLSRYEWKYILENSYGIKMYPYMATGEHGDVRGVLPSYLIRDYSGQPRLFTLKFGLCSDSDAVARTLLRKVGDLVHDENVKAATITSGYDPYDLALPSTITKTVVLSVQGSEEKMWQTLRGKTRNMIRKAVKEGIKVESGVKNLEEFYSVYTYRMLQKGVRLHSFCYFQQIFRWMGENAELFVARRNGDIVGGMLLVFFGDTGAYIYGGSISDRGLSPNQLLLWEMVRFCIERGISNLDLGESVEGSGVYNFKIWFGGQPKNIYYYQMAGENGYTRSLLKNPIAFCRGNFLRLSSHLILKYSPMMIRRKTAIWKRQRGPLQ